MNSHSFWFVNRMFLLKILVPAFLTLALFIVSLYQIIIPRFEAIALDRKREMTRELIYTAWHIADRYNEEVRQGRMTLDEAKQWAIKQMRHLRYGAEGKDYFWITDYHPTMVAHPFREELNGTDLSNYRDSHGKRLFVEMVRVVRSKGEGFVDYTWQWKDDSTRIVPKLSYVKAYQPWGWIIGTGMYIEDVEAEIAGLERNIIVISIWITIAISLLLFFIAIQNLRSERKRLKAESDLTESKEKYEALVEATTEGHLMVLDDKQTFYNKTLLAMLGYDEEESRSLDLVDIFPDVALDELMSNDTTDAAGGALESHFETQLKRKDSSRMDVLLTRSPIAFYGKQGVLVIVKDICHHKQIENELDESREKFMALTNRLSLAIFRTDATREMRFLEANTATVELFGFSGIDAMREAVLEDRFDDAHIYNEVTKDLFDTGQLTGRIVRCKRGDGSAIPISLSVVLVKDHQGNVRYCDCLAELVATYSENDQHAEDVLAWLHAPMLYLNQPIHPFIREIHTCAMNDHLGSIARMMNRLSTDIVFVKADSGNIIGFITSSEVRDSIDGGNESKPSQAYKAMKSPIVTIPSSATVYDVLDKYMERGSRYFGVKDTVGSLIGVVSAEDVQKSQLSNNLFFLEKIRRGESVGELRQSHEQLRVYLRMLIERGATVENVTAATTMISDSMTQALIKLGINQLGPPPARFAFIALGSEGRSEQTLATDQDNAIIYEDPEEIRAEEVKSYFVALGDYVCNALDAVGYDFCKGNVMAKNPKWCCPLQEWKRYFHAWVNTANPQDLLEVNIFFDFRHVFGEESLTDELSKYLRDVTSGNNAFFVYLTQNALKIRPPSWQFKAAEFIDLKVALLPMIDLLRIYALKHKVPASNSMERLQALTHKDVFSETRRNDMTQVYTFLMMLRYRHQARRISEHAAPNNNLSIHELSETEKIVLKRVLSQIEDFQTKLSLDFKGTM